MPDTDTMTNVCVILILKVNSLALSRRKKGRKKDKCVNNLVNIGFPSKLGASKKGLQRVS